MNSLSTTHRWLTAIVALLLAPALAQAQALQIIDNGTIATGAFSSGQIGGDCSGVPGPTFTGFEYNGEGGDGSVLCGSSFLLATSPTNVIGTEDKYLTAPVNWVGGAWTNVGSPFPDLEVGHTASFSDLEGVGIDVDYSVFYSNDNDSFEQFFVAQFEITNNSGGTLDLTPAQWMDWDIAPFASNTAEHDGAFSQWVDGNGTGSVNTYGTAVLQTAMSGTTCAQGFNLTDPVYFAAMTTLGPSPCAPGDIRGPVGAGTRPGIPNGGSTTALFCIIGADDATDFAAQVANCQIAVIPVELLWFESLLDGTDVSLTWATASETNNAGFEVQMDAGAGYQAVGFVDGHGTTTEAQTYSHVVRDLNPGTYSFRLKQIDFDGAFEYHGDVEVSVETPDQYVLLPAYPNPFNPGATIRFAVRDATPVTLTLHDALGRQVSTLYSGTPEANQTLSVRIDGSGLPSGMYLVRLKGSGFSDSQAVTLLK